jgi:hypothetical protein
MIKTKVKVKANRRQSTGVVLPPYKLGKGDVISLDAASCQAIKQIFSMRNGSAQISELIEVARVCLPFATGGRWTEERMNSFLEDPIHVGYHIRREGEKYVMTRLNFPDPPVSLEMWLECNPWLRKRPIRLE